jgi:transposase
MQLKTLLNHVQKHKSFVFGQVRLETKGVARLVVGIRPRARSQGTCSGCGCRGKTHDTLPVRHFQFVPMWGLLVFFAYAMRRIDCKRCGPTVERVPWADGKSPITTTYAWFLAGWAKQMSWTQVASAFRTSWDTVYRAATLAVAWGLANRDLSGIRAIGVDEVLWHRGHKYLTVVYQIDGHCRRLLWVGLDRTTECLEGFFNQFGPRALHLRFVCSDMWRPYIDVLARRAKQAIHILDRFHIAAKLNKAIDEVRAAEVKQMQRDGREPVLKHSRWCLLRRPEHLSETQYIKLADLLKCNLKTIRAYLLKEDLQLLWEQTSAAAATKFLSAWIARALRSHSQPIKKFAKTMRNHQSLIMNWFEARGTISGGAVEGMNNKLKVITRRAFGFRTFKATQVALYHSMGGLPVPRTAHKFF